MNVRKVLITGAGGQIGENLIERFIAHSEIHTVVATDIDLEDTEAAHFAEKLDVLDAERMEALVKQYGITEIYHLAALLSASGEKKPMLAWDVNMQGLLNVLETAKKYNCRVFWPSSIAIYGDSSPKQMTPQTTIAEPTTVYGISKLSGELWCQYYSKVHGLDIRSVRFPGLISWQGDPGGGTTDYAVDIFHQAIKQGSYTCFLEKDTYLPMLYMDDAIEGIVQLMDAPEEKIKVRTSYNMSGLSFSPRELSTAIQKHMPDFTMDYAIDFRQTIADSWPASIDDTEARKDWGWDPKYNLDAMVQVMLTNLTKELEEQKMGY